LKTKKAHNSLATDPLPHSAWLTTPASALNYYWQGMVFCAQKPAACRAAGL